MWDLNEAVGEVLQLQEDLFNVSSQFCNDRTKTWEKINDELQLPGM